MRSKGTLDTPISRQVICSKLLITYALPLEGRIYVQYATTCFTVVVLHEEAAIVEVQLCRHLQLEPPPAHAVAGQKPSTATDKLQPRCLHEDDEAFSKSSCKS